MQGLELLWPVELQGSAEKRSSDGKVQEVRSIKMIKVLAYLDPNESLASKVSSAKYML